MPFLHKASIKDLQAACPDCPVNNIHALKRICSQSPPKLPYGPAMELVLEVILSRHILGPERGSNLRTPNDFVDAVHLYEAACFIHRVDLAKELSEIIRNYIEEDYLSNEEIEEFMRRMPRKDPLKAVLAMDLAEQMAVNEVEGGCNIAQTRFLAQYPELLKAVKKQYRRLTDAGRNDKFVAVMWDDDSYV